MASVKQDVYESLKYRIITHELRAGVMLKETDLMKEYGIGRTPLRETFIKLERDGFIQRFPRSGTFVSPLDFNQLKQITQIREYLEQLAGELAAENITENGILGLQDIMDKVNRLKVEGTDTIEKLKRCEDDFHKLLYAATGNPKLAEMLEDLQCTAARFWHHLSPGRDAMHAHLKSAGLVVESLKKRDPKAAGRLMRQHVSNVQRLLSERLKG